MVMNFLSALPCKIDSVNFPGIPVHEPTTVQDGKTNLWIMKFICRNFPEFLEFKFLDPLFFRI